MAEGRRIGAGLEVDLFPVALGRPVGGAVGVGVAADGVVAPRRERDGLGRGARRSQGALDEEAAAVLELQHLPRGDGQRYTVVHHHVAGEQDGQAAAVPEIVHVEGARLHLHGVGAGAARREARQGGLSGKVHEEGRRVGVLDVGLLDGGRGRAEEADALVVAVQHAGIADGRRGACDVEGRPVAAGVAGIVVVAGVGEGHVVEHGAGAGGVEAQRLPVAGLGGGGDVGEGIAEEGVVGPRGEDDGLSEGALGHEGAVDLEILAVPQLHHYARLDREVAAGADDDVALERVGDCRQAPGARRREGAALPGPHVAPVAVGGHVGRGRGGGHVGEDGVGAPAGDVHLVEGRRPAVDPDAVRVGAMDRHVAQGRRRREELHRRAVAARVVGAVEVAGVPELHVLEHRVAGAAAQVHRLPVALLGHAGAIGVGVAAEGVVAHRGEVDGLLGRADRGQGPVDRHLLASADLDDLARHDGQLDAARHGHVAVEMDRQSADGPRGIAPERARFHAVAVGAALDGREIRRRRVRAQGAGEGAVPRASHVHAGQRRRARDDPHAAIVGVEHVHVA